MLAEQLHIDHVTVAGRDLHAMQQASRQPAFPPNTVARIPTMPPKWRSPVSPTALIWS